MWKMQTQTSEFCSTLLVLSLQHRSSLDCRINVRLRALMLISAIRAQNNSVHVSECRQPTAESKLNFLQSCNLFLGLLRSGPPTLQNDKHSINRTQRCVPALSIYLQHAGPLNTQREKRQRHFVYFLQFDCCHCCRLVLIAIAKKLPNNGMEQILLFIYIFLKKRYIFSVLSRKSTVRTSAP